MRFSATLCLLVLSCLCLALAQVSYPDCCLKYVTKMSHRIKKHAVDYTDQRLTGECNIAAVIFTMRRGRKVCTDPREQWVQKLKKKIDDWKERNSRHGKVKPRNPSVCFDESVFLPSLSCLTV
uniref:C-C motif chemokine n=1 Tax=Salarias fasciatus TaxID=181472 RepID=A0A672HGW0_SALFA